MQLPDDSANEQPEERVATWVRDIARLDEHARVHIAERACARPGWPPFEVVIRHEVHGVIHERTIHRRLAVVTRLDVEAAWRGPDTCCDP